MAIDASIPDGWRWITKEMSIQYLKKPKGKLLAVCSFNAEAISIDDYINIPVKVVDTSGHTVVKVTTSFYICSESSYAYMYV